MSMTDIVSHLDLAIWPKMALVLFLAVFCGVIVRVMRTKKSEFDAAAQMPFEEEATNG